MPKAYSEAVDRLPDNVGSTERPDIAVLVAVRSSRQLVASGIADLIPLQKELTTAFRLIPLNKSCR